MKERGQMKLILKDTSESIANPLKKRSYKGTVSIFLFYDMYSYTIIHFYIKQMGNKVSGKV